MANQNAQWWNIDLETKPDFEKAMQRIYAWYEREVIDRPPIRFHAHNSDYEKAHTQKNRVWPDQKSRWFDAEFQLDFFAESIKDQQFLAETFPIFWPNLGPEVYSAFYGSELIFQEVTSYSVPLLKSWDDLCHVKLDTANEYFKKTEELMLLALERCKNKFMVGYTDLHPGVDCAAAWRDPQEFCIDLLMEPDKAKALIDLAFKDFQMIFDRFDKLLKMHNQLSVTWMGIPSFGKMHVPSCDFSSMISPEQFEEFVLPGLINEIKPMTHNIYHLDGKGVANHIDMILDLPEINAIQWVQGMADDQPIMQWVPLIKKIQAAGKSVVIDLQMKELDQFMEAVDPKGVFIWMAAEKDLQPGILKKLEKWK